MLPTPAPPFRQQAAPVCLAIKVVTGIVLLADAVLLAASFERAMLRPVFLIMAFVTLYCYLTAPVAFELDSGGLAVVRRSGRRSFGLVVRCSRPESRPPLTLRVWGNGGVFAGTGWYWNRQWGMFRAYVTAGSYKEYVLVETEGGKVLISPEDPAAFAAHCGAQPQR